MSNIRLVKCGYIAYEIHILFQSYIITLVQSQTKYIYLKSNIDYGIPLNQM